MTEDIANSSTTDYVKRLGLDGSPFSTDGHTNYFYPGAMRGHQVEQVVHFSRFSDQLVMLLGASGSGTSTVLQAMLAQLQPVMDCCLVNVESNGQPEQILQAVTSQLQLANCQTSVELLAVLRSSGVVGEGMEPLLIAIDQAHFLSLESLEFLKTLYEQSAGLIRLVLAGEYQIEQLAKLAGFDAEQIKILELEPLTTTETADYLRGKLASAGYLGDEPITTDQLAVLQEQSAGNIADINRLAPALLAESVTESKKAITIPVFHGVVVAVLGAALLLALFYQGDEPTQVERKSVALPMAVEPVKMIEKPITLPGVVQRDKPATAVLANEAGETVLLENNPVVDIRPEPSQPRASEEATVTAPDRPVKAGLQEASSPRLVTQQAPLSKSDQAQPDRKIEPAKTAVPIEPPLTDTEVFPHRERRLLAMPANQYMLQLLGSVEESRTRGFVKNYVGRLPITYFETRLNGKPWFVALTGPYESKLAAVAGIEVLPEAIKRQRPWARSLAGVQKDIKKKYPD